MIVQSGLLCNTGWEISPCSTPTEPFLMGLQHPCKTNIQAFMLEILVSPDTVNVIVS